MIITIYDFNVYNKTITYVHTVNPEKFGAIKISSLIRRAENLIHEIFLLQRNRAILIFTVNLVSTRVHYTRGKSRGIMALWN